LHKNYSIFTIFLSSLLIVISPPAYAHKLILTDDANVNYENVLEIPDHKISWAIYENLDAGEAKFYSFNAKKGDSFYASIVIPKLDYLINYKPSIGIFSKSLELENKFEQFSQFNFPDNVNGIMYKYDGPLPSTEFYEPFGQVTYWERQEIDITLPNNGVYYLVVFNNEPTPGKYSLAVGKIEQFSALEIFTLIPISWLETKLFFEDYLSILIAILILIAIPALVCLSIFRKKRKIQSAKLS
jgi:hypothetical protein